MGYFFYRDREFTSQNHFFQSHATQNGHFQLTSKIPHPVGTIPENHLGRRLMHPSGTRGHGQQFLLAFDIAALYYSTVYHNSFRQSNGPFSEPLHQAFGTTTGVGKSTGEAAGTADMNSPLMTLHVLPMLRLVSPSALLFRHGFAPDPKCGTTRRRPLSGRIMEIMCAMYAFLSHDVIRCV